MRRLLLASVMLCSLIGRYEAALAAQNPKEYKNESYGFSVELPAGLSPLIDPPPAPQHGFAIDLDDGGRIWVDGSYDAALTGSPSAYLDSIGLSDRAAKIFSRETILHMPGARSKAAEDGRIRDVLVAFRTRHDGLAIVYTFGLDTDERHAARDEAKLRSVIARFRMLPLPS